MEVDVVEATLVAHVGSATVTVILPAEPAVRTLPPLPPPPDRPVAQARLSIKELPAPPPEA